MSLRAILKMVAQVLECELAALGVDAIEETFEKTEKSQTNPSKVLECELGVGWCDWRQLEAGAAGRRPHLAYQTTTNHCQ